MKEKLIIGIDPGKKGGIAFYHPDTKDMKVIAMPVRYDQVFYPKIKKLFLDYKEEYDVVVYIELQRPISRPNFSKVDGITSMIPPGKKSLGVLMEHFGYLQGLCLGIRFNYILVTPQQWQKKFVKVKVSASIEKKYKDLKKKETKIRSISLCHHYYPELSLMPSPRSKIPNDGMADAVMIATSFNL